LNNKFLKSTLFILLDAISAAWLFLSGPILSFVARARAKTPLARSVLDRQKVSLIPHHYYEPIVTERDIRRDLSEVRQLNGFDLNEKFQLDLIEKLKFREELKLFPINKTGEGFFYKNSFFEYGDAEMLYSIIRHFMPKNITEIGCGFSSLIIEAAISRNKADDPSYSCRHLCIEPFEAPFLDRLGIEIMRKKVEECDKDVFLNLGKNDILFIDSSHVIRPQGDVLFEYSQLMGMINSGVLVHVHDVFTPRDYPKEWVLGRRFMWNEQYLLEAFLSYNTEFEVVAAVNWLKHTHFERLAAACPMLEQHPASEPGSFWFRRR
jgi:Methyltransferase domain